MHGVHPEFFSFFSEQRLKYNFGIGRRHLSNIVWNRKTTFITQLV